MSKSSIKKISLAIMVSFVVFVGCSSNEPAQAPAPAPQVVAPAPAPPPPPPPAVPAQPPPTPLVPVGDSTGGAIPATGGGSGTGGSIDKGLPGEATSGDELLGNYSCSVDAKQLKLGPFKAPPFGCKIFKAGDALKVASTADSAGSIKGSVKDSTAAGFFIVGTYEVAGNALAIKARMKLQGENKYVGRGRGRFNDDKSAQINYTLTMTKK